jgi:hypothetical protein
MTGRLADDAAPGSDGELEPGTLHLQALRRRNQRDRNASPLYLPSMRIDSRPDIRPTVPAKRRLLIGAPGFEPGTSPTRITGESYRLMMKMPANRALQTWAAPPLRSPDFAFDSRGFGSEIDLLPNRCVVDRGSLRGGCRSRREAAAAGGGRRCRRPDCEYPSPCDGQGEAHGARAVLDRGASCARPRSGGRRNRRRVGRSHNAALRDHSRHDAATRR